MLLNLPLSLPVFTDADFTCYQNDCKQECGSLKIAYESNILLLQVMPEHELLKLCPLLKSSFAFKGTNTKTARFGSYPKSGNFNKL